MWTRVEQAARLFLVFVAGGALSYAGAFPFKPYLHNAFLGTSAVTSQVLTAFNVCSSDVWYDAAEHGRENWPSGVTLAKAGQFQNDLALITVGQAARLIGRDGKIIHEWHVAYGDLPAANGPLGVFLPADILYWQRAVALPDGDLVVMVNANCRSPDGLAIMRLDRNSHVKWVRHGHYHHDFDVAPDGTIHVLWQEPVSSMPTRYAAMELPFLNEGIEIISPSGESLKRVSILEAFAKSRYSTIPESPMVLAAKAGDRMHNNNVDVLNAGQAGAIPGAKAGDVLLSLREVGTIAVLDMAAENISWAMRGSWQMQHDPDVLPNGNLLLFDNRGDWGRHGGSRIMEINPRSEMIVWQYPEKTDADGKGKGQLWTGIRGEQVQLPNGNVLINETQGGRLLEVNRQHDVVWEYRCPDVASGKPNYRCNIMSSRHYAATELPFISAVPEQAESPDRTEFAPMIKGVPAKSAMNLTTFD